MSKKIRVEGKTYVVPDDATDAEINHIVDGTSEGPSIGGVASTMADQAGRAIGAAGDYVVPTIKTLGRLLYPPTTGEEARSLGANAFNATTDAVGRTRQALANKNYGEAAKSAIGAVPLFGPPAEQITRDVTSGQFPEAIGHAGALYLMGKAPQLAEPAVGAVGPAGAFTKGAARGVAYNIPNLLRNYSPMYHPFKILPDLWETGKTAIEEGQKDLADYRYRKLPKVPRIVVRPEYQPPPDFTPPLPGEISLPSGRVPGKYTEQPAAPQPGRRPLWEGVTEPFKPKPSITRKTQYGGPAPSQANAPAYGNQKSPPAYVRRRMAEEAGGEGDINSGLPVRVTPPPNAMDLESIAKGKFLDTTTPEGKAFKKLSLKDQSAVTDQALKYSTPEPVTSTVSPFKGHSAEMTDLIRQWHSQWPKGTSMRDVASQVYGLPKGTMPSYEQALKVHEYMLRNQGKIPTAQDLGLPKPPG